MIKAIFFIVVVFLSFTKIDFGFGAIGNLERELPEQCINRSQITTDPVLVEHRIDDIVRSALSGLYNLNFLRVYHQIQLLLVLKQRKILIWTIIVTI